MTRTKIPIKRNINSLIIEIPYRRMPIEIRIVEIYKKPLLITY